MEKKYEYRLRDEKYEDAIHKIAGFYVAVECSIIISERLAYKRCGTYMNVEIKAQSPMCHIFLYAVMCWAVYQH